MLLRKKTKQKNNFIFIKNIFLIFLVFIVILFFYYFNILNSSAGIDQEKIFIIEKGQSVSEISANLHQEGLIKSEFIFKLYIKKSSKEYIFREGSYNLNYKMNMKEVLEELTKNISLKPEKKVTFIEGWSLKDYARILEEKELFSSEEFLKKTELNDYSNNFDFLKDKPDKHDLEGYLFPDTYNFFEDASVDDVINRMLQNFDKKLTPEMRAEIKRQSKSIHEIITMASIIEKEVQSEKDMKMVSGLFWNRIKNRQALESCATLAYILGVNKAIYTYEDTRTPSAYNTYTNRGLPPGPIANPGVKAIEAAIYPESNNYNYFLTDPKTRNTIFSRTYEEHLLNKNKYLR